MTRFSEFENDPKDELFYHLKKGPVIISTKRYDSFIESLNNQEKLSFVANYSYQRVISDIDKDKFLLWKIQLC